MELRENSVEILTQQLVRRYTDELEDKQLEGYDLCSTEGASVLEKDQQAGSQELDFWLKQLNLEKHRSSRGLRSLDDQATKLFHAWQVFHRRLPIEQQNVLNNSNPSWVDIVQIIEKVQASWMAKNEGIYGKATARLRKILDTVHSHQTFLSILPQSNNYASIFCGSVQVLIQASATYRTVAEGLSQAILEINDIVRACSLDMHLFPGNDQVEMAAALYCRIFEFLEKAMVWYTKSRAKRFINSFKEDAYEQFESDVSEIRRLSGNIMRRAQQSVHIENRTTNLIVQETRRDSQRTGGGVREMRRILDSVHQNIIGKMHWNGEIYSLEHTQSCCTEMLTGSTPETEEPKVLKLDSKESCILRDPDEIISKASLADLSALRRNWGGFESLAPIEPIKKIFVETTVRTALWDWRLESNSCFLCVSGPWQKAALSPAHQLATAICSFAIQMEIPLIHFSCVPSIYETGKGDGVETTWMVNMVYSLMAQLIQLLPEEFEPKEKIVVADLDATTRTFTSALSALSVLLDASPSPLFCVIDNLQHLEDPTAENEYLMQFLKILQAHGQSCRSAFPARCFKVLFTTSGRSTSLVDFLEPHEMVLADSLLPIHSSGRSRPSQVPMVPISPDIFSVSRMGHHEVTEEDYGSS